MPVLGSNGIILKALESGTLSEGDKKQLHQALEMENAGAQWLGDAMKQGANFQIWHLFNNAVDIDSTACINLRSSISDGEIELFSHNTTPLTIAASLGYEGWVDKLLAQGTKPDGSNSLGCPLKYTIWSDVDNEVRYRIAEKLLAAGANPDDPWSEDKEKMATFTNRTPLMEAAIFGDSRMVNLLLQYNARVNIVDCSGGESALYFALRFDHEEVVNQLLAAGAEIEYSYFSFWDKKTEHISLIDSFAHKPVLQQKLIVTALQRAEEQAETVLDAQTIAIKGLQYKIAQELGINMQDVHIKSALDDKQKPTLHVTIGDKTAATNLCRKVSATLRKTSDGYMIRMGQIRCKQLINNDDYAAQLFTCATSNIAPKRSIQKNNALGF